MAINLRANLLDTLLSPSSLPQTLLYSYSYFYLNRQHALTQVTAKQMQLENGQEEGEGVEEKEVE